MGSVAMATAGSVLPELRQDLRLYEGPSGGAGQSWLIYDPVRHRYFQIAGTAFELIERWRPEASENFARRCEIELGRPIATAEVNELAKFVIANNLVLQPPRGDAIALAKQEASSRHSWPWLVVHHYLFFKVPLVRPERFLTATMPFVAPLYSRTAAILLIVVSMIGLYFASRQWDLFVATFLDFLSVEGALIYGVTLILVKALHELGHAYTAIRSGVRVNTMGIAFMVMTPILYTDVTDAWRLRHRFEKIAIDGAGIVVELALAGISIFLWAFLPDGPLRSAAFVTATTSLIMGLMINLNPLLRFDGYYLLSDAWRIPNLQSRSNALAVWWMRERLFSLRREPPEAFSLNWKAILIFYAICLWVYRFFLFLGIALIVYHVFFKILGIVLFAIEIIWFILLPILREIREWWRMREAIMKARRTLVTASVGAAAGILLLVPWSGTVMIQGVALSDLETRIYAPRPGRIKTVALADGSAVAAGQQLVVLQAPDLDHEVLQTKKQIELARLRLDRIAGDEADRSNRIVLEGELVRHQTNLEGLKAEQSRLIVVSPHYGIARDVDRDLQAGEWIDEATPVARIVSSAASQIQGYVSEDSVWRITSGAGATFIPEDPMMARQHGIVTEVVPTGARSLELPYLASVYGGAIAADRNGDGEIKSRTGRHLVRVQMEGPAVRRAIRGTLHITGKRESIAVGMWRRALQVLVRESSA